MEEAPKTKGSEKVKSKRVGTVDVIVKIKISWPHEMMSKCYLCGCFLVDSSSALGYVHFCWYSAGFMRGPGLPQR